MQSDNGTSTVHHGGVHRDHTVPAPVHPAGRDRHPDPCRTQDRRGADPAAVVGGGAARGRLRRTARAHQRRQRRRLDRGPRRRRALPARHRAARPAPSHPVTARRGRRPSPSRA
ncbi:hypothetical protein SBRY_21132 [Actinacidiphila bryophytorum]|uniref:Uncharacterized protein n=1 Tax=Actinacidiphila bryophytorum TaxID=1436133 RepID=A0A9W4E5V3_9ACTN|nr:hypothetical protein SBRY_21132 [Actinacidiphila bryophytorum]